MKLRHLYLGGAVLLALATALPAASQETATLKPLDVAMVEGTYAGTFLCSLGEMGMTLTLNDEGEFTPGDFAGDPCRSALGRCNDREALEHKGKRKTSGTLNFFPIVGNPGAPAGAFKVSGWVDYKSNRIKKMEFQPGEWLDKPDNFGSSAMTGRLINGVITGKPTAPGCYTLKMRKIQTWKP